MQGTPSSHIENLGLYGPHVAQKIADRGASNLSQMGESDDGATKGIARTYSLTRFSGPKSPPTVQIFVGEEALADFIASLGPEEVEDRAGGVPHPTEPGVMCIPLPGGRVALIDAEDYPLVKAHTWQINDLRYAHVLTFVGGEKYPIRMHRLIHMLGDNDERVVDHRNHDTLDNRKSNTRVCTHQQNIFNQRLSSASTTGIKGVHRYKGAWRAVVGFNGRDFVKECATAEEAESWARAKRTELHGEFACHG